MKITSGILLVAYSSSWAIGLRPSTPGEKMFQLVMLVTALMTAVAGEGIAEEAVEANAGAQAEARLTKLFGDKAARKPIAECAKIEAYRLESFLTTARREQQGEDLSDKQRIGRGVVISGPVQVDKEMAKKIVALLTDPAAYRDRRNECEPMPGVAIRFVCEDQPRDVMICLECDVIYVMREGKSGGAVEFQPAHDRFVKLAKELFPNDPLIQKLK